MSWGWVVAVAVTAVVVAVARSPCVSADVVPPTLVELYKVKPGSDAGAVSFAEEKRGEAMRLAAVAFGAQAGLARQSWEIAKMLAGFERQLTRIYRFDQLVLKRSGFQVVPRSWVKRGRYSGSRGRGRGRRVPSGCFVSLRRNGS